MSSYRIKRSFSRNTIRHQVLTRQGGDLQAHFSNELIAWTKKPGVEIVEPKAKESKKFLNSKAYETIPLLSGFRRYMSVDVLHESKSNRYEVILKKQPSNPRDKLLFENAQLRRYSLKFNPERQDDKIHSLSNLRSKSRLNEHNRIQSQMVEISKKGVEDLKSIRRQQQKRMNSIISEILYKKEQGLTIEGNKIQYQNTFRISGQSPMSLLKRTAQGKRVSGTQFYRTAGPQIIIEDSPTQQ